MNLSKDALEKGVIINPEGTVKEYERREKLTEGELLDIFSETGLRSEIKVDGKTNLVHKKGILITKTFKQAMMEAILTQFYSMCCLNAKTKLAGDG